MRGRDTAVATCSRQILQKHAKAAKSKDSKPVLKRCYHLVSCIHVFDKLLLFAYIRIGSQRLALSRSESPAPLEGALIKPRLRCCGWISHFHWPRISPIVDICTSLPTETCGCQACSQVVVWADTTAKFTDLLQLKLVNMRWYSMVLMICFQSRKISGIYFLWCVQKTCCPCCKPCVHLHSCLTISWKCPANPCTPTLTPLIVSASEDLDLSKVFEGLSPSFSLCSKRATGYDWIVVFHRFSDWKIKQASIFSIIHCTGEWVPSHRDAPRIQQLGRSQFRGLQTPLRAIGSRGSEVRN